MEKRFVVVIDVETKSELAKAKMQLEQIGTVQQFEFVDGWAGINDDLIDTSLLKKYSDVTQAMLVAYRDVYRAWCEQLCLEPAKGYTINDWINGLKKNGSKVDITILNEKLNGTFAEAFGKLPEKLKQVDPIMIYNRIVDLVGEFELNSIVSVKDFKEAI